MILYHASPVIVEKPDIIHSRKDVDFGPGFYLTELYEQARNWCRRLMIRNGTAYINRYSLDESAFERFKVLAFESYSEQWLDFIAACRSEKDRSDYDIVMGGVANDRVFNTLELYFSGLVDKSVAIERLRYEKPNSQLCIRTQIVLDECLHYLGSEKQ